MFFFGEDFGGEQSLIRCLRSVVSFDDFGSEALFLFEFLGGAEEVVVGTPRVFVEVVDAVDQLWMFEPLVTEKLAHVRPIFLFDVRVIVFVIRAAAREGDRFFSLSKISHHRVI